MREVEGDIWEGSGGGMGGRWRGIYGREVEEREGEVLMVYDVCLKGYGTNCALL